MIAALALALILQAGREPLGVFDGWGAFRDASPRRCFAIAEPIQKHEQSKPFVSIATWPGDRVHNQLHVRLSRARAPSARVTLSIGERRFDLVAGEADAWSPDARTDAAVVSAIREGRSMSVETVAATGAPFADTYALKGAATAIDAAALGCVGK
ncbi:MAG: invasion associated locus B family protein [Pseudomonadota bacterium]